MSGESTPAVTVAAYSTNTWLSPLARLRLLGPADHAGFRVLRGAEGSQVYPELAEQADLVVIQRDFPRRAAEYAEVVRRARRAGKPLVFELDDLLFDLPETHPDRASGYYTPALAPMLAALAGAGLVTTPSAALASGLRPLNPRLAVLPNYLDDRLWSLRPPTTVQSTGAPLVIGCMGGDSHAPDLQWLAPALLAVARRYAGKVRFEFIGAPPPQTVLALPGTLWTPTPTLDYAAFAAWLSGPQGPAWDIVVAPLADNRFNRCKSGLKFLEYAALGAAGVYADLEPYQGMVQPGETGLLAGSMDDWEQALCRLLDDPDLRWRLAQQAQDAVRQRWLLSQNAGAWLEAYRQLLAEPPPPVSSGEPLALRVAAQLHGALQAAEAPALAQTPQPALAVQPPPGLADEWVGRLRRLRLRLAPPGSRREAAWLAARRRLASNPVPPPAPAPDLQPAPAPLAAPPPDPRPTLIVFPVMEWATRLQRPQQLARQFARAGWRVIYLSMGCVDGPNAVLQPVEAGIEQLSLPRPAGQPPNPYFDALPDELAAQWAATFAPYAPASLCLVELPFWAPLALRLRREYDCRLVYDCLDLHSGFHTSHPWLLEQEETLLHASDVVLASAWSLYERARRANPRAHYLPNAADYAHFAYPAAPLAARLGASTGPLIGYYGAIADWFDTALVGALARQRPAWQFVLIGSTLYADLAPLDGLPNVHLLGELPYTELPQFLHSFDVCMIPFKTTPLTQATNPVKLFEYLSAGKPVVATRLDELRRYAPHVRLAASLEEWLAAIAAALEDRSPAAAQARRAFARANTWEQRFTDLQTWL